ncbi:MAG: YfhO family protein [Rikenellaceae bacterium]|jgi:hypothetical protein|nr:YfhO family protein [Rikenellaceae bacterium]
MKPRNIFSKALPYIVAVVIFYCISALYFLPQYEDKTLQMSDVQMYRGMAKEPNDHQATYHEDPQWTGSMFGGMPAYLISMSHPAMIIRIAVGRVVGLLGEPMSLMFIAMLGFWVMLLLCGVNPWVGIIPAIAYGLSTYNIIIIEVGHITKMRAIGYAPMMLGAVFYAFRRNIWIGGGLTALFSTLAVGASHHQITYYFVLVLAAFWINELVGAVKDKVLPRFWKATAVVAAAGLLAVGANFTSLWYTMEHTPETVRGGSELAEQSSIDAGGLDLEYATAWSYGTGESLNMFIPDFRGGSSSLGFSTDGAVASALKKSGIHPSNASYLPAYWGEQPFTAGPTYIGAVMIFLFVLGMFTLSGRRKWWILAISAVGLLLAWGRNAMWFTELAFAILPGYGKFRTVSMALTILQWSVPFVAALVMSDLWKKGIDKARLDKGLRWSLGITGGVALFFALFGGWIYDFGAASDGQFANIPGLVDAMRQERAAMFTASCWRSLVFVVLAAAVVWAFANRKGMKQWMFVVALGVLTLADLLPVDLKYLSHSDFKTRSQVQITPTDANKQILEDTEPGFRVFNTANPFNESLTSYFHRSVGGYHGAKLSRYQDVIDRYLAQGDAGVLNMLNTKYYIVTDPNTGTQQVVRNADANGAAWFLGGVFLVDGAHEEIDALGTIDNKTEAVVDARFEEMIPAEIETDPSATIALTDYRSNYLRYETHTAAAQVAVFSEIYYDKGWKAFIDGEEVPYFRADYILRAMEVPAGDHVIEWKFRAPHFATVEGVTLASSIAILLWLAAAITVNILNNGKRRQKD